MPLDNRRYELSGPVPTSGPRNTAELEELYARAALACYRDSLHSADPDEAENLIAAGAWFARLGQVSIG